MMIITSLSALGLILALVVMIISSYVAIRINTIDVQSQVCITLNSTSTELAYSYTIMAALFTGMIIAIFIAHIIFDAVRDSGAKNINR